MGTTLLHKLFSSLVDTVHYWSGSFLDKPVAPAVPQKDVDADAPLQYGVHAVKQSMVALTLFMEPTLFEAVASMARAMQVSEQDALLRLVKIAKLIHEFGLYGVPTPDGNYLGIHVRKTGEVHRVNLDCPAQVHHKPPQQAPPVPTPPFKPPTILN